MSNSKQVVARSIVIVSAVIFCAAADQLSKQWAVKNLSPGEPQPFIQGLLQFNIITNPGAAFSLGSSNGEVMGVVATVFSLLIFAWIVNRIFSTLPLHVVEQLGMGCILGGAIGNLLDRFKQGQVTDFLEFTFIQFPVFNVADALIDVGIVLLFISIWIGPDLEPESKTDSVPAVESPGTANE